LLAAHYGALRVAAERLLDGDTSPAAALCALQSATSIGAVFGVPSPAVLADVLGVVRIERERRDGPDGFSPAVVSI